MENGIDQMRVSDYDEVAALWEEVGMWPHAKEDRAWLAAALERNPTCALVWREQGRVIGTVIGAWDGLRGWIYHLAVTGPRRGRGIGTALLEAAEARLKELGVGQINLMVYEENAAAHAFYLARGYQRSPAKVVRKRLSLP